MAVIHISESDAARDFANLLAHVRSGSEVVIEDALEPIAVLSMPTPPRRTIEECIALLPVESAGFIDDDFARDVESFVARHRESLDPPAWD